MRIKIPSKQIYEQTHKLPKSYIDKVEYKDTDLEYNIDFLTLVQTNTHSFDNDPSWVTNEVYGSDVDTAHSIADTSITISTYAYVWNYYATITFSINKYKNQRLYRVIKLYSGKNDKGENHIKHTVKYTRYEGTVENPQWVTQQGFDANYGEGVDGSGTIPNSYSTTFPTPSFIPSQITATASPEDRETIGSNVEFIPNAANDAYTVTLTIRVGQTTMGYNTNKRPYTGTATKIVPKSVEVSFYGDKEEYEQVEIPLTFGDGNKVFSLDANELASSSTIYQGQSINEYNSRAIISNYKNGKETLELMCSIGEYYDYDTSELVISTKQADLEMSFNIGDIVIPHKFTAYGDKPFSMKKGDIPKEFLVTKVDFIFDGAVWQKISLQEI